MEYKGFIYAPTPKTAWDNLSMQEKSEMMKVAVRNGITDLKTIREKYNEFAEGGNLPENDLSETNQFGGGGYVPSRAIRQRIANWEGAAMDRDTIDPLSGKMAKKNRSFEEVATGFVNAIPKDIRGQVLSNQELADNLYSYAYNVGPGKFRERVIPALRRYYQGNGSVSEVTDSMWASGDKKLKGLRRRRTEERSGVSKALQGGNTASPVSYISQTDNNSFVPFQPMLPEVFKAPHPIVPYSIADTSTESQEATVSPYDTEELEEQSRRNNLQHFMNVLNMVYGNAAEDGSSFFLPFGALSYNNTFDDGGKIHIKPENKGKFTALKKRTGHSATWFKEHGTPAQKKMAVFELNARHWKHGLGGNLFDDGGNKDNIFRYTNNNGDVRYVYQDNPDAEEVPVRPLNTIFPDPAQWTFTDDAGKFYTPRRTAPINMVELNPDNRTGFERALDNYIGEAFNTVPKGYHTLPAIGAAAFGLANPAIGEAALTSGFGSHGLSKWMNGEVNGPMDAAMTALEVAPLGRLAKPVYEGVVQPGMRLFNSPLTGNWTKIGNREYRLSPNGLGANSNTLESKVASPQVNITDNLLKWLDIPDGRVVEKSAQEYLNNRFSPEYQRMAQMLQNKGIDLSRLDAKDIKKIFDKRLEELRNSGLDRVSVARPIGDRHFSVSDFILGRERPVGEMGLEMTEDGTALITDITNYTRNTANPVKGVQERGLNSAINISKSVGGNGVITGREYQSAPRQYHVVQKFKDRNVIGHDGIHYNSNMVNDYENRMGLPNTYDEYIIPQDKETWKGMLELARAGERRRKALYGAPVWKLGTPTFNTPTKSILFDPTIIDNEGRMIVDWDNSNIFRRFGGRLYTKK